MSEFWNKKINEIEPYVAGEQPKKGEKVIKLNTNENPYPPTPMARVILRTCDVAELRLYPNASSTELLEAVAEKEGAKTVKSSNPDAITRSHRLKALLHFVGGFIGKR